MIGDLNVDFVTLKDHDWDQPVWVFPGGGLKDYAILSRAYQKISATKSTWETNVKRTDQRTIVRCGGPGSGGLAPIR